jgi:hypothetical protein
MNISFFKKSLAGDTPPEDATAHVKALWYDKKGDWNNAHNLIQDLQDKNASWIHAYLHRKEGDVANADYWYLRAGKQRFSGTIENEWEELLTALIG